MNDGFPTLSEIRSKGQKPRHREVGNWLARRWARPTAIYGTWLALRFGIPAHAVTAAAAAAWLGESVCLAAGDRYVFLLGTALGYLGFWLDHVDGQVARVTGRSSPDGIFLDFWIHTAHAMTRAAGLGCGLYRLTGDERALIAGMCAAFGWVMIGHANDAMYKAIFAELKSRRDRGECVRSKPTCDSASSEPRGLPVKLKSLVSWPLAKSQEPHVVLVVMTLIATFLLKNESWGIGLWSIVLAFWAVTSPVVAVARAARMVRNREVTERFDEWFENADDAAMND